MPRIECFDKDKLCILIYGEKHSVDIKDYKLVLTREITKKIKIHKKVIIILKEL